MLLLEMRAVAVAAAVTDAAAVADVADDAAVAAGVDVDADGVCGSASDLLSLVGPSSVCTPHHTRGQPGPTQHDTSSVRDRDLKLSKYFPDSVK